MENLFTGYAKTPQEKYMCPYHLTGQSACTDTKIRITDIITVAANGNFAFISFFLKHLETKNTGDEILPSSSASMEASNTHSQMKKQQEKQKQS